MSGGVAVGDGGGIVLGGRAGTLRHLELSHHRGCDG